MDIGPWIYYCRVESFESWILGFEARLVDVCTYIDDKVSGCETIDDNR